MAGDLEVNEYLTVLEQPVRAAPTEDGAAGRAGPAPYLHRYGDRVLIGLEHAPRLPGARTFAAPSAVPEPILARLTETERLGLEALSLRQQPEYVAAKLARPREGEAWNMLGCTTMAQALPPEAARAMEARAAAPTSSYLEGSVAVGLIIVEGPTPDLQFTQAERTQVVAEVQNGLSWLASMNPYAGINFSYDIQIVTLDVTPDPSAADLEAHWRDPAMAALGYDGSWSGVAQYVEDIRTRFGTRWTYCGYFTKYPLGWFAYASIGGPRLVMNYANDGWGPDNIDRVFAHESGHIFGCPDEYASSGCDCDGAWGRFSFPNVNCENCAPNGGVNCLMKGNTWALCNVTPAHLGWFVKFPAVRGVPAMIQSRFGTQGNFELIAPASDVGLRFCWRNNDDPILPWEPPFRFAESIGSVEAVSLIQSNFGSPGNLELIARAGDQLNFFWRDSGPDFRWSGPWPLISGAAGNPVLIQSRFGSQGNFELVVPAASGGGILFLWRNNDDPSLPWSQPIRFGESLGTVDEITMIQSNFGSPGNLELIARAGEELYFFWRDSGPAFQWNGPWPLVGGARGNPVLIQSRFGSQGNFELVVPAASGGGILFLWRNNDDPSLPWSQPIRFGESLGMVDEITMIQSNFGVPGNLELVARAGEELFFFWRDSGPAFQWSGPWPMLTIPSGAPARAGVPAPAMVTYALPEPELATPGERAGLGLRKLRATGVGAGSHN